MLNEYLKSFTEKPCGCGKSHKVDVPEVCVKSGAINDLPLYLHKYNACKVFLIADKNTFKAAGKKVCKILADVGVAVNKFVYESESVKPDEKAVGNAILHFQSDCDVVIGVGSGVINDTAKIVSAVSKKPYIIVATAPSMDGYASSTSSMDVDGLKVSLPSKCADVIIGDTEILKNAPYKMLQAGLGDMLAKYISIAEWRIAHEIVGEYYCEEIANLVRIALKKCVDNADGLLRRDESAVESVFEGLVLCGIAMSFAGLSRPASGVEHYFSHVWDMRGLEFNTKTELHGLQCAVATKISARLYEKVLKITPNKEKAMKYVSAFKYECWCEELRSFLGKASEAMIAGEKKEGKYNKEKHTARLDTIIEKWDKIRAIIREEIPKEKEIDEIFNKIKSLKTPEELGIDADLFLTFKATKDIRDKYVLSRLLWDLGEIEDFKKYLKNSD